ncbi:MAG: type II secretion system protein M [Rhodobacter sp.]|nr:type II secretion system protein M [Paracoccaceae bacterium]MCC0076331.1 type II secretion system protein M [Rhodobacter sp.]
MIAALARNLAARSPRERLLIAALAILVVPLALWFLAVVPLMEQRAQARSALAEAQATRAWYLARQDDIAALPVPGTVAAPAAAVAPVGLGGIEARLIDAGLRDQVGVLTNVQGGSVTLALDTVGFGDLMAWIDGIEAEAGYRLSALRLVRGTGPGVVDAELRLDPQEGGL